MDFREALLINRYCSSLNSVLRFRPIVLPLRAVPALASRWEATPRLTQAGSSLPAHRCANLLQQPRYFGQLWSMTARISSNQRTARSKTAASRIPSERAAIEFQHPGCDFSRELLMMRHNDLGHAFTIQFAHDIEYLVDKLRIEL